MQISLLLGPRQSVVPVTDWSLTANDPLFVSAYNNSYLLRLWTLEIEGVLMIDVSVCDRLSVEPLGMPALHGYGWPRFEFGEKLGISTIVRKLG